ncbi:MAG: hypothetical protein AAFN76_04945 [Pseudomonadota bacterium]
MIEIEHESLIARWFDAVLLRHQRNAEWITEATETQQPEANDVRHSVNSILHLLIEAREPDASDDFAESLVPPSVPASPEQSYLASQQQLAQALNHLSADAVSLGVAMVALVPFAADHPLLQAELASGPVNPYGQVDETGSPDLLIYNASYIPARYWPPYVRSSTETVAKAPDEAEVIAYLTDNGIDKDLLSKAATAFRSAAERLRFLSRLGALVSVVTYVLATLRRELADPALSADDIQVADLATNERWKAKI